MANTTPLVNDPMPPFLRVPAYLLISGLFTWFVVQAIPDHLTEDTKQAAWYWEQIEKQRAVFLVQLQSCEDRKEAKIQDVSNLCYGAITNSVRIAEDSRKRLDELGLLVKESCIRE